MTNSRCSQSIEVNRLEVRMRSKSRFRGRPSADSFESCLEMGSGTAENMGGFSRMGQLLGIKGKVEG